MIEVQLVGVVCVGNARARRAVGVDMQLSARTVSHAVGAGCSGCRTSAGSMA
jgi:hypothetical protein